MSGYLQLIDELIQEGYLKTPDIIKAFNEIKREDFLRAGDEERADINAPLSIDYGQTISQPLTVAFMLELLNPKKGDKILDIGSGSGWTVALLAKIVGEKGRVYGLEIIEELRSFAETNVSKYNFIKKGIAQVICTDGYQGLPEFAQFDKIIVAAAAEEIPGALPEQLKIGGRLVIPVGRQHESQEMVVIDKVGESEFKEKRYPGFIFVPLVKR